MVLLRPVQEKDDLFIEEVYRSTREAELSLTNWSEQQKNAFSSMQSMAQLAFCLPGGVSRIKVQDKFFECCIKDDSRPISIGM